MLVTLAEMEQVRSSEQQAKTRQIYHHQEEMRAVRIDHERERAELLEVRTHTHKTEHFDMRHPHSPS